MTDYKIENCFTVIFQFMKSFQNKNHEFRTLKTRPCVHGRSSLKHLSCGHRQNPPINQCHNSVGKKQQSFIKPKEDDQHTKMMRSLIAMNEDYFQDKLHVSNDGKPSRLKLKIPSQTGFTVYKRDYIKNLNNHMQLKKTHQFKQSKVKADFFAGTTYGNQFLGQQNEDEKFIRKKEQKTNLDAPTFHESQYKHNFLNWGSGSHMPSMKPHPSPATTNLPFHPSTMYSTEFTAKQNRKKQNFNPNNSSCLSLNSNHIASPLLYLTTNDVFFDKKNNSKEGNLKPKTHTLAIDGGAFKGKTEYQSEFVKQKGSGVLEESGKKPLNELQNMILNL